MNFLSWKFRKKKWNIRDPNLSGVLSFYDLSSMHIFIHSSVLSAYVLTAWEWRTFASIHLVVDLNLQKICTFFYNNSYTGMKTCGRLQHYAFWYIFVTPFDSMLTWACHLGRLPSPMLQQKLSHVRGHPKQSSQMCLGAACGASPAILM
jgi:hypothetical protein